ncbi:putative transposase Tra5 [Escherichia coli 2-210-07_S3_C3]|nr:putative transposase Tra5 [Escherichia coli 2-210-07_S3_C3]
MKAGRIWLWSRAIIGWSMSSRMTAQEAPERYATACHLQK